MGKCLCLKKTKAQCFERCDCQPLCILCAPNRNPETLEPDEIEQYRIALRWSKRVDK
jgi:hypothetical protein